LIGKLEDFRDICHFNLWNIYIIKGRESKGERIRMKLQVYGHGNEHQSPKVKKMLDKWKQKILKKSALHSE